MSTPTTLSRREFFAAVATIASGLWLGGLVMLFMSVSSIFKTFDGDRATAGLAATGIFQRFETYQIILAGIAIASIELSLRNGKRKKWIGIPLIAAAVVAMAITFGISPKINALRLAGETASPMFKQLHGAAMLCYLGITALVALGMATLAISMFAEIPPRVFGDPESPAAPADPATTPR